MPIELVDNGTYRIKIDKPIITRTVRTEEVHALSAMWNLTGQEARQRALRRYYDEQQNDTQRGLVADFNGTAVGQLWIRLKHIDPAIEAGQSVGYIHTLVVMPEFRRLGVAEGLIRTASILAQEHGRTHLTIGVDRANNTARRLYMKWGFERYHESFDLRGDLVFLRRPVFESEGARTTPVLP